MKFNYIKFRRFSSFPVSQPCVRFAARLFKSTCGVFPYREAYPSPLGTTETPTRAGAASADAQSARLFYLG